MLERSFMKEIKCELTASVIVHNKGEQPDNLQLSHSHGHLALLDTVWQSAFLVCWEIPQCLPCFPRVQVRIGVHETHCVIRV
jgi:hypothetical protein